MLWRETLCLVNKKDTLSIYRKKRRKEKDLKKSRQKKKRQSSRRKRVETSLIVTQKMMKGSKMMARKKKKRRLVLMTMSHQFPVRLRPLKTTNQNKSPQQQRPRMTSREPVPRAKGHPGTSQKTPIWPIQITTQILTTIWRASQGGAMETSQPICFQIRTRSTLPDPGGWNATMRSSASWRTRRCWRWSQRKAPAPPTCSSTRRRHCHLLLQSCPARGLPWWWVMTTARLATRRNLQSSSSSNVETGFPFFFLRFHFSHLKITWWWFLVKKAM